MKKIFASLCMAITLLGTGMTVSAEPLLLPRGERIEMGDNVRVWNGAESFIGKRVETILASPQLENTLEEGLVKAEVYGKEDKENPKLMAKMVAKILREAQMYQVRMEKNHVLYTGLVLSIPVDDKDILSIGEAWMAMEGFVETNEKTKDHLTRVRDVVGATVDVRDEKKWKNRTSKSGVPYGYASANVVVEVDGLPIPLYMAVAKTRSHTAYTYTIFVSDQESGLQFDGLFEKALEGATL